jgi:hypothetical protein
MTARSTRYFREQGGARSYRSGSKRRLRQIRFRGNWSPEAIVFLIMLLLIFTVLIPWLVRHPPDDLDHPYVPERPAFRAPD